MKIKPLVSTTLAKDAVLPAIPGKPKAHLPAGSDVLLNTQIKTKYFNTICIPSPNPVFLFLITAERHFEKIKIFRKRLKNTKETCVFPGMPLGLMNTDTNNAYGLLIESIGFITSLVAAIETFCTMNIPANLSFKKNGKTYSREDVERLFGLEDKLEVLAHAMKKNAIKQQPFWSEFMKLKKLRNDIIHYKSASHGALFSSTYSKVFDFGFGSSRQAVFDLMEYYEPGYFNFKNGIDVKI